MNNFIKQVIEEKFASKAQQRFFYAQAGKGGKKGKKWAKWAKEFSADTDFKKIPEKAEKEDEIEEIVDDKGNIKRSDVPLGIKKSTIGSKKRTDKVVKTGAGAMGTHGVHGTHTTLKYWAESDMSGALGYDDTLGDDATYDEAYEHFTKKLGLPEDEAKERLKAMGYIPNEKELVRLVENPKKYMKDYIESVLVKKTDDSDVLSKDENKPELNPLIKKQIDSLKKSLKNNNISIDKIINHLKSE
jgi:hypothetical protein